MRVRVRVRVWVSVRVRVMVRVRLSVRPRVTLRLLSESVEPSTSSLVLTHDSELLPDFGVVEPISRLSQCLFGQTDFVGRFGGNEQRTSAE